VAPTEIWHNEAQLTVVNLNNTIPSSITFRVNYTYVKKETKEQKIKRIAKEKMLASWKSHNEKRDNIIEIKRVCKPIHNINRFKR